MKIRSKKEMKRVFSWILTNRVAYFTIMVCDKTYKIFYQLVSGGNVELSMSGKIWGDEVIDFLWKNRPAVYAAMPEGWIDRSLCSGKFGNVIRK